MDVKEMDLNAFMVLAGIGIILLSLIFPTIGEEIIALPLGLLMIAVGVGFSFKLI